MAIRTRTRQSYKGTYGFTLTRYWPDCSFRNNQDYVPGSVLSRTESCTDHTSSFPYTDGDLDLTKKIISDATVSGNLPKTCGGTYSGDVKRVPLFQHSAMADLNTVTLPVPAWSYYTTKALANINPGNPKVDFPLFLFELREFPGMLRDLGRVLSQRVHATDVPGGYLAYRFGWAPLFSDLYKLLTFADIVEKRANTLIAAQNSGGVRIQRRLDKNTFTPLFQNGSTPNTPFLSYTLCTAGWKMTGEEDWWYSARLKLTGPIPTGDPHTAAFRSVLGLNLSAATIWNALPWSWLVDYLVNIGDFLDANRNYVPHSVDRLNIMCHQTATGSLDVLYVKPGFTVSPGECSVSYKGRRVVGASPRIVITPFLSLGQLSILGSLLLRGSLSSVRRL